MDNIEKENKRLKVLIIILVVILLGLGCYHYYVTYINADKNIDNEVSENDSNVVTEKEYTKEELLALLEGTWYSCSVNSSGYQMCYVRNFYDNSFHGGLYATGGGYGGEVKSVSLLEKNKYVLVTYDPGCHGTDCLDDKDPQYASFIIDITNISNKTIIIDDVEIKYAAKDVESASKIIDNILYN